MFGFDGRNIEENEEPEEPEEKRKCSSCKKTLSTSIFVFKGKSAKTCNACLERKRNLSAITYNTTKHIRMIESSTRLNSMNDLSTHITQHISRQECKQLQFDMRASEHGSYFSQDESPKEIATFIKSWIEELDGYSWICQHASPMTFQYICSCRDILSQKHRKHEDVSKQRDRLGKERYQCGGAMTLKVDKDRDIIEIKYNHDFLHAQPKNVEMPGELKDFIKTNLVHGATWIYNAICQDNKYPYITQKQVYAYWTSSFRQKFISDPDPRTSAKKTHRNMRRMEYNSGTDFPK
jgi:ribosomal protein RSM22 (predicted rRNA methylase)